MGLSSVTDVTQTEKRSSASGEEFNPKRLNVKLPILDARYMKSVAADLADESGKKEIRENLSTIFTWMKKETLS